MLECGIPPTQFRTHPPTTPTRFELALLKEFEMANRKTSGAAVELSKFDQIRTFMASIMVLLLVMVVMVVVVVVVLIWRSCS